MPSTLPCPAGQTPRATARRCGTMAPPGNILLEGVAMLITGGCLCRAVRYEITAAPIVTRVCWCRLCQYIGAGSGTVNVCFASAALTVHGEPRVYRRVADSGNDMQRGFCPGCGTHLFSAADSRPHLVFVRAGTLD